MYIPDTDEPSPTVIKGCPCCGAEAFRASGRAACYIQCDNPECGLATKAWPNFDKAIFAWNRSCLDRICKDI